MKVTFLDHFRCRLKRCDLPVSLFQTQKPQTKRKHPKDRKQHWKTTNIKTHATVQKLLVLLLVRKKDPFLFGHLDYSNPQLNQHTMLNIIKQDLCDFIIQNKVFSQLGRQSNFACMFDRHTVSRYFLAILKTRSGGTCNHLTIYRNITSCPDNNVQWKQERAALWSCLVFRSHIIALLMKAWMKGYNQAHMEDSRRMSFALSFSTRIMLKAHFKSIKLTAAANETAMRVSGVWQINKRMR